SGFVRDAFGSTVLPAARVDPVALRTVQFYPLPNRAAEDPTGRNNFIATPGIVSDTNQYTVRLDHQIRPSNRLFARYSQNDAVNTGNPPIFALDNIADPRSSVQRRHNKSVTIGDTHAFSARLINEVRLSVSRQHLLSEPAGYNIGAPAQLGLPAIIPGTLFPRFNIGDVQALGSAPDQLAVRGLTVGQLTDSVSLIWGKHTFKTGVDLRVHQRNNFQPIAVSGLFNFSRGLSGNPQDTSGNSGFGLATFLLGSVSGGSLTSPIARADGFRYYAAFVQDDYRLAPRLTLNLGLRYDLITAPTDRFDRYSNFDPDAINAVTGRPGVLQYAGVDFGRQAYDTNYRNFGPRVGFAFDVGGDARTIVRSGYGLFYYHSAGFEYPDTQGYSVSTPFESPRGVSFPGFQLSAGPPQIIPPSGSSLGPRSFLGNNVTYFERHRPTPRTQQWNVNVQRELPGSTLIDVAYAGSRGLHLIGFGYDLNQLDPQYLSLGLALDDRVPNPLFGRIPPGTPISDATISRSQSLRPYPAYLSVTVANPPLGTTTYHSGQLKVERRFTNGLGFLGAYTYSRLFGDVGRNIIDFAADRPNLVGDPQLPSDERSIARWFNTAAFEAPPPFTFGTTPRTLDVRGPGFASVDFSVSKNIFVNDSVSFQLRSEFFNLFNRVNYNLPDTNFLSGGFGTINSAGEPRRVQFGVKAYF
ncbi:MAG: TonB-dependent receptor, partial [Acidobacteria bacterium]|nr:TonB-dependent receptor [Acidobacteriota bacterium]